MITTRPSTVRGVQYGSGANAGRKGPQVLQATETRGYTNVEREAALMTPGNRGGLPL